MVCRAWLLLLLAAACHRAVAAQEANTDNGVSVSPIDTVPAVIADTNSNAVESHNNNTTLIRIAGIFDTTNYDWSPDIFEVTVQMINDGEWGVLPPGYRVVYELEDSSCNDMKAVTAYWNLFHKNAANQTCSTAESDATMSTLSSSIGQAVANKRFHGIVGPRCSGAAIAMARFAGLANVPQISPTSNSALLSDKAQFPLYNRMVPPSDERGHAGATIALIRRFGWDRIGILSTDTQYSKQYVYNLRKAWIGSHTDEETGVKWTGHVAFDVSVLLSNQTNQIDVENTNRALGTIATSSENQQDDTKVIVLVGHPEHTEQMMREVYNSGYFSPKTIWIGVANQIVRNTKEGLKQNFPPGFVPGWLEIAPRKNTRDPIYQRFLGALRNHQMENNRDELSSELPNYGDFLVDGIRALVLSLVQAHQSGLADTGDGHARMYDGRAVTHNLRNLEPFDGVSGKVKFNNETGDPKDFIFAVLNAQSVDSSGRIDWKEIGTTSTTVGSVNLTSDGIGGVCFPEVGCGLSSAPDDTFPPTKESSVNELAFFLIFFSAFLGIAVFGLVCKYRSMQQAKAMIQAELESFQDSVVGMRTAECNYMPRIVSRTDVEQGDANGSSRFLPAYLVNFRVTSKRQSRGGPFRESLGRMLPATANFRASQVIGSGDGKSAVKPPPDIALGTPVPAELENEPRLVLCQDDIVQITSQRLDGWAFGTKLYHSDEDAERQLVTLALIGAANSGYQAQDGLVSCETGWLEISKTRDPTKDDLRRLHQAVGETEALDPPVHWETMTDAAKVHKLEVDSETKKDERDPVLASFLSTLPSETKVENVQRVQNLALWQSYIVKRRAVYHRETGHFPGEDTKEKQHEVLQKIERRWMFHGCDADVVDKILQQGFNRSFCGKNATLYGKGVYFARDSAYSSATVYAKPDTKGRQYILASRVIVGDYCLGKEDALTPDVRDQSTQSLYDSTVDNVENPSVFVTYHDAQAYPEYLITFSIPEGGDLALLNKQLLEDGEARPVQNFEVGRPVFLNGAEGRTFRYGAEGHPMGPEGVPMMGPEGRPVVSMAPEGRPLRYAAEGIPIVPVPPGTTVRHGAEGQPIVLRGPEGQTTRYGPEGTPIISMDPEGRPWSTDTRGSTSREGQSTSNDAGGLSSVPLGPEGNVVRYGAEGKPVVSGAPSGEPILAESTPIESQEGVEGKFIQGESKSSVSGELESKPIAVVGRHIEKSSVDYSTKGETLVVKSVEEKHQPGDQECALPKESSVVITESASSDES